MLGHAKCSGQTIDIDGTFSSQGQLKFRHSKACRESVESRERLVRLVGEHAVARDKKAAELQVARDKKKAA